MGVFSKEKAQERLLLLINYQELMLIAHAKKLRVKNARQLASFFLAYESYFSGGYYAAANVGSIGPAERDFWYCAARGAFENATALLIKQISNTSSSSKESSSASSNISDFSDSSDSDDEEVAFGMSDWWPIFKAIEPEAIRAIHIPRIDELWWPKRQDRKWQWVF